MERLRTIVPFVVHTSPSTSKAVTFEGYASVFNTPIDALAGPTIIERGAFTKTLSEQWQRIKILWQHNSDEPIGRPLEMAEDEHGLKIRAVLSSTPRGEEVAQLLRDGVVDEMSIGFDPVKFDIRRNSSSEPVRHITELRLWEVSLVTHAACASARVTSVHQRAPTTIDERMAELLAFDDHLTKLEQLEQLADMRREHDTRKLEMDYINARLGRLR